MSGGRGEVPPRRVCGATGGTERRGVPPPGARPTDRGTPAGSLLLLALVAVFCALTHWGRMYPTFVSNSAEVWSQGHRLSAPDRRMHFWDETYAVLLYIRELTPPDAVVLVPPERFIKEQVARRRPPGEDLIPLLGSASSAYGILYPRVAVHDGSDAPLRDTFDWLLVWDHWGLELVDPSAAKTEKNRVQLVSAALEDSTRRGALEAKKRVPAYRGPDPLEQAGPDRWVTPGLLLGLLVLAGLGDGFYRLFRRMRILPLAEGWKLQGGPEDLREQVGWRVLLALASVPWIVILLDLTRIRIDRWSFAACGAIVLLAGRLVDRRRWRRTGRSGFEAESAPPQTTLRTSFRRAPAAWVLGVAAGSLVLCNLIQMMILPERNYDALVGWDLVGKVTAFEGKLRSSIFSRIAFNAQAIYAPFTSGNHAFGYIFHPAIYRLWIPLLTGAFLLVFHRRVRLWTGSATAASFAAFVLFLPRAFLAQLTMAMTDLPSMAFTALAFFAGVDLLRGRGGYGAAALLLLIATTARTENLLPAIGLTALCLLKGIPVPRRRDSPVSPRAGLGGAPLPHRLRSLWIIALPATFFAFWNLFYVRGQFGYDPGAHFRSLDLDFARMLEVLRRAVEIIGMRGTMGEFWVIVLLTPVLWALGRLPVTARWVGGESRGVPTRGSGSETATVIDPKRGSTGETTEVTGMLLLISLAAFLCYLAFFYMWDPVLNPLWSMEHTFKRGFFRFMPGIVAAFLALPIVARLLRRCEA